VVSETDSGSVVEHPYAQEQKFTGNLVDAEDTDFARGKRDKDNVNMLSPCAGFVSNHNRGIESQHEASARHP